MERLVLHSFKEWRVYPTPLLKYAGGTECFKSDLPLIEVINLINSLHKAISSQVTDASVKGSTTTGWDKRDPVIPEIASGSLKWDDDIVWPFGNEWE